MRLSNVTIRRAAIAGATGLVITTGLMISQTVRARNGCVRTLLTSGKPAGGQEIVYSWGCISPQRFRQWSVMAAVTPIDAETLSHAQIASR